MTKRQEVCELIDEIDVYSKDGRKYYIFDAGDHRYRNIKSFGPWIRSLSEYIFKDKWTVEEVYWRDGAHALTIKHKVAGGMITFKLWEGRLLAIDSETGSFDLIDEGVFMKNYRLIDDVL